MNWTQINEKTWRRIDGVEVVYRKPRSGRGQRPWMPCGTNGERIRGYFKSFNTGPAKAFGSADRAMREADKWWPL